ncbi:MAG: carboxylating nicotinate-nucleotide diphosphorylase [Firmicutes bacterium]|nr:carboxylating nicotinate-nucleotide diphosphorylase [Alicyclobacillaceae bacterium]MCL6497141.1 carboxylating nicotinate-nucleotide diphosphorylase [Bacillota bacterium]
MLPRQWQALIQMALDEDIGQGDVTTWATIPPERRGRMDFVARQPLVVCGFDAAEMAYRLLDPAVKVVRLCPEGERVAGGTPILRVEGPAASLLSGERVALNFVQHLSAIATITRTVVDQVRDLAVTILDTRKTTPGWRPLEKYAVRVGGAKNHRYGLSDAVLIKDNHIAAAGGIRAALERVRQRVGPTVVIEVEVDRLDQIPEALAGRPHGILLDNMDLDSLRQAVAMIHPHAWVEASGGIRPDNVRAVAETGVDFISLGYLTHSAPAVDIGADWVD